jgi:hypothetical protein
MKRPPLSRMLLTPSEPRDSTLPKPNGNFSVGGLRAQDTVARVMKSETRSVREWTASADSAVFNVSFMTFKTFKTLGCKGYLLTLAMKDVSANAFANGHCQIDKEANACYPYAGIILVGRGEESIVVMVMRMA